MTEFSDVSSKPSTTSFKFNTNAKPFVFRPSAPTFMPQSYPTNFKSVVIPSSTSTNNTTASSLTTSTSTENSCASSETCSVSTAHHSPKTTGNSSSSVHPIPKLNASAKAFNPKAPVFTPVGQKKLVPSPQQQSFSSLNQNYVNKSLVNPSINNNVTSTPSTDLDVSSPEDPNNSKTDLTDDSSIAKNHHSHYINQNKVMVPEETTTLNDSTLCNSNGVQIEPVKKVNSNNNNQDNNTVESLEKNSIADVPCHESNQVDPISEQQEGSVTSSDDSNDPTLQEETVSSRTSCGRIIYRIDQLIALRPLKSPTLACIVNFPCYIGTVSAEKEDSAGQWGRETDRNRRDRGNDYHMERRGEHSPGRRGNGRDRGDRRRGDHRRATVDTAPALEECKPLEINEETRWKPHSLEQEKSSNEEIASLIGKAKSLLNKLSVEKFERLSDLFIEIAIKNDDTLAGCIDIIVSKAQMEWHFAEMYANLSSKMYHMIDLRNKVKRFKPSLLARCQEEFEEEKVSQFEGLSPEDLEEKKFLAKRKTLGHIKFIGELFRQQLISSHIMHGCIQTLFGDVENPDEEDLECLCKLLTTVGLHLDDLRDRKASTIEHSKMCMTRYFKYIEELSNGNVLGTRVRFMLKDLIELRKNSWVARRKEAKAVTIAEIHAEAKREEREKSRGGGDLHRRPSLRTSSSTSSLSRLSSGDFRRDSANVMASKPTTTTDSDGWSTVPSKPSKLTKSRSVSERSMWSVPGSSLSSRELSKKPLSTAEPSRETPKVVSGGSFSVLGRSERRRGERKVRDLRKEKPIERSSSQLNSEDIFSRQPASSVGSMEENQVVASSLDEVKQLESKISLQAFKEQTSRMISDFVASLELNETIMELKSLECPEYHAMFVLQVIDVGLSKKDQERSRLSSLISSLAKESILTAAQIKEGLSDILEVVQDLELDIPLVCVHVGELMAPSVETSIISIDDIISNLNHLKECGRGEKIVLSILKSITDSSRLQQIVAESKSDMILRPQSDLLIQFLEK